MQAQAATLAYIDVFWILSIGAGIMFVLSFFPQSHPHGGGRGGGRVNIRVITIEREYGCGGGAIAQKLANVSLDCGISY